MRRTAPAVAAPAGPISPEQLRDACERAKAAARSEREPADAVEAALAVLHGSLDEAVAVVLIMEHGRLWLASTRGYAMIPEGFPIDEGVVGRAVREGRAQLVLDVAADADFVDVVPGVLSELAIPLVAAGEVVGVLDIETKSPLPAGVAEPAAALAATLAPLVAEIRNEGQLDLSSLARLFVHLGSLRDPQPIGDVVVRSLPRVLPVDTARLLLRDESGALVEVSAWQAGQGAPAALTAEALGMLPALVDPSAVFELLGDEAVSLLGAPDRPAAVAVVLPLRASGEELGFLLGTSAAGEALERQRAEVAALLAAHTAASLDAAAVLGRERLNALTDSLTGLLNRRGLEERLEQELTEAQAARRPLSLIVLDCDDFKEVNDRAGHAFGDALLREIGSVLGRIASELGCAARLGGDEFVVMLAGTEIDQAESVALDVQARLASGLDEAGFPLHLSAGVSTYPYDGAGATQLLRAADQALYEAKALGKDRVVAFRELVRRGSEQPDDAPAATERRGAARPDVATLEGMLEASSAIWGEQTPGATLVRLAKSLAFVVGAIAAQISRIDGETLVDVVQHKLRDVDIGEDLAYLIDDFPITKQVLETGTARALSFLDADLDPAEAFVLREVEMNCCLLLPIVLHEAPWGLVELYDMRLRRFTREDQAVAGFLVQQAARRLESFGDVGGELRSLRLFRVNVEAQEPELDGST